MGFIVEDSKDCKKLHQQVLGTVPSLQSQRNAIENLQSLGKMST